MKQSMSVGMVRGMIAGLVGIGAMGGVAGCSSDGPSSGEPKLMRSEPATKEECPAGGGAISTGLDDDGDGVLDEDEIDERRVVCNPLRELTRIVAVPPGAECVGGGTARGRGLDRNGNDLLDDEEVEETIYECSTILPFSVTIRTDAEAAALAQITEIQGHLFVDGNGEGGVRELSLPQLRKVTGMVSFGLDAKLTSVSMSELAEVGDSFSVGGFPRNRLRTLSFPKLTTIGGDFSVGGNPLLLDWQGLSAVEHVGGAFRVTNNPLLMEVRAPKRRVVGAVSVSGNSALTELELRLSEGAGDVSIASNPALVEATLAVAVTRIAPAGAGAVRVIDNSQLTTFRASAPKLGSVQLERNPVMSSSSITVERVGQVDIRQLSGSVHLNEPSFGGGRPVIVEGSLLVSGPIQSLLIGGGRLRVEGRAIIQDTQLTSLFDLEHVGGDFFLDSNSQLRLVEPIAFLGADIVIDNNGITDVDFVPQQEIFGTLTISRSELRTVGELMPNLRRIHGSLVIRQNARLLIVRPPVTQIDGGLTIDGNPQLVVVRLDNVAQLTTIRIEDNPAYTTISLPALHTAGAILILRNHAITELLLPQLTSATLFHAADNPQLSSCGMRDLCARLALTGNRCLLTNNGPDCR